MSAVKLYVLSVMHDCGGGTVECYAAYNAAVSAEEAVGKGLADARQRYKTGRIEVAALEIDLQAALDVEAMLKKTDRLGKALRELSDAIGRFDFVINKPEPVANHSKRTEEALVHYQDALAALKETGF